MVKSGGAAARLLVLSLLLGGCASSGSVPPDEVVLELPRVTRTGVQPGDQVTITVYTGAGAELTQASGERIVDPSGEIFLPLLRTVRVIGMETADIRRVLEEGYGQSSQKRFHLVIRVIS